MINVCIIGPGRAGMAVAEHLNRSNQFQLVSMIDKPGSPKLEKKLSEFITTDFNLTIKSSNELAAEIIDKKIKVAIDFTTPEASVRNARILAEQGVHIVIGTTGFNTMQLYEFKKMVQQYKIGLVYAPNISVGINLLLSVAKTIARLIPQYDVEVTETSHRDKKDSPSGAALKIANDIFAIKGLAERKTKIKCGRKGNKIREVGEIGVHSLRAGGNVGVHQVLFAGETEEIEIIHRSYSHANYADGALKAAAFIAGLKGFFHMEDVLMMERMDRDMRVAANRLFLKFN